VAGHSGQMQGRIACFPVAALLSAHHVVGFVSQQKDVAPHIERTCRPVQSIFKEMGTCCFQRAHRMDKESFWQLHRVLFANLGGRVKPKRSSKKKHCDGTKNGLMPSPTRLSIALRHFAGGGPDDTSTVHGASHTEVHRSVWRTINAVNKSEKLRIQFPSDHAKQRAIAAGFCWKSGAGFNNCVGAIDGLLVWIEKPHLAECEDATTGVKKFFCGRKKKFGMNMQAVCDHEGRFLDVSIGHPASALDSLCFATSSLEAKIKMRGFLALGLCLFRDDTHTNSFHMATPWKGIKSGVKDDCNFHHSQVRTKIECAFGMLVAPFSTVQECLLNLVSKELMLLQ